MANGEWRVTNRGVAKILFAIRHSLFALALLCSPNTAPAQVRLAAIPAHPALWVVHSKTATVYLFGSIHLLPANLDWHTQKIDHAMESADTFYFEVPLDDAIRADVVAFMQKNGSLPPGTTLRSLLDKAMLADYERALEKAHVPPKALDGERPWLAALALDVAYLQQMHYVVADGVDQQVYAFARAHGKTVRAFETVEQQLQLFMPRDRKLELAEFDVEMKDLQTEQETIGAMVDAWGAGDANAVGRLVVKDMEKEPEAKKLLIDDRNRNWIKDFDAMLAGAGTYFVTVGTGHLVGPKGVPALLRAKGYSVEGP
jgi:uncharacterized protein YbaP (TraB family)